MDAEDILLGGLTSFLFILLLGFIVAGCFTFYKYVQCHFAMKDHVETVYATEQEALEAERRLRVWCRNGSIEKQEYEGLEGVVQINQ